MGTKSTAWVPFRRTHAESPQNAPRFLSTLRLVHAFPARCVARRVMDSVLDLLRRELSCFAQNKWRKVVANPVAAVAKGRVAAEVTDMSVMNYSYLNGTDSNIHAMLIYENSLILCEAVRWTNSLCNNVLELLNCELENCARLLYLSTNPMSLTPIENEPVLLCHLLLNYSASVGHLKKSIRSDRRLASCFSATGVAAPDVGLQLERKQALLLFYCLVQFRNFKATGFNVLYLAVADAVRGCWQTEPTFSAAMSTILDILRANLHSGTVVCTISDAKLDAQKKRVEFFSTTMKTNIVDKGPLYAEVVRKCSPRSEPVMIPRAQKGRPSILGQAVEKQKSPADSGNEPDETETKSEQQIFLDSALSYFECANQTVIHEEIATYYGKWAVTHNFAVLSESFGEMNSVHLCALHLLCDAKDGLRALLSKLARKVVGKRQIDVLQEICDQTYSCSILATCMYLTAFTLITGRQIDPKELPTLACRVLTASDPNSIFAAFSSVAQTLASESSLADVCTGAAVLAQLGQRMLALRILMGKLRDSATTTVLLLLLHGAAQEEAREELPDSQSNIREILEDLERLGRNRYLMLTSKAKSSPSVPIVAETILSTSQNRSVAMTAAALMLPSMVAQARSLADFGRAVRGIVKERDINFTAKEPEIVQLLIKACAADCEEPRRQTMYNACFMTLPRAELFLQLIQEICAGLSILVKSDIVGTEVVDWSGGAKAAVKRRGMESVESELNAAVVDALELLWTFVLVTKLAGLKPKLESQAARVEYASCLIRCARLVPDKNRELKYIRSGIRVLAAVNFSDPAATIPTHVFQELGNALGFYLGDWEASVKVHLGKLMDKIRAVP